VTSPPPILAAAAGLAAQALHLYLPLLLLGALAGLLHALGRRSPDPKRRRLLDIAWIVVLLAGAPVWMLLAVFLGWL
jgi:hypothetical protein